jgi:hypothetical protein
LEPRGRLEDDGVLEHALLDLLVGQDNGVVQEQLVLGVGGGFGCGRFRFISVFCCGAVSVVDAV